MLLRLSLLSLGLLTLTAHPSVSAQDSYGIERGTGAIICTYDKDDNRAEDDPSYARAALWDAMVLGISPCELTPIDEGTWGVTRRIEGLDEAGRSASFKLYVLNDRYSWKLGSSREIQDAGRPVPFRRVLQTPQFFERFCAAKAALSLGAASFEGPTPLNHKLASARADRVSSVLNISRTDCPTGQIPLIYSLSLGEHQNTRPASGSAPQRRAIIVAAEEMTIGVDLRQALRTAFKDNHVLRGFEVDDYDLFEVEAF